MRISLKSKLPLLRGCLLSAAALLLASCSRMGPAGALNPMGNEPLQPPRGMLVTMYQAPLDINFSDEGTGTEVQAARSGVAEAHAIRFWFIQIAFGDASLETASEQAGISSVSFADYELLGILGGLYTNTKVRAYGQ